MNQKKAKEERRQLREASAAEPELLILNSAGQPVQFGEEVTDYLKRRVSEMTVKYSPWTPFEQIHPRTYVCEPGETVWVNSRYTVYLRIQEAKEADQPRLFHLSIKRNDKEPIHDWRELQRLKNEIVGPEQEMIELYPAESRLVDSSNQFHLWGFERVRIPFGFAERLVIEVPEPGGKQRAFEPDTRPDDVQDPNDPALKARIAAEWNLRRPPS